MNCSPVPCPDRLFCLHLFPLEICGEQSKVIKFLTTQFSAAICHVLLLTFEYSLQPSCLKASFDSQQRKYFFSKLQWELRVFSAGIKRPGRESYLLAVLTDWLMTVWLTYVWLSDWLILWNRILLEKLTGFQLVKKFPAFYGTRGSLPNSQVPANCPYPEPARSSPYPHILLPEDPS